MPSPATSPIIGPSYSPPLLRVQYVYLILSSEGAPQLTLCNDPFSMVQ